MTDEKNHLDEKKFDLVIIPCNVRQVTHQVAYILNGPVSPDSVIFSFDSATDLGITIGHILDQVIKNFDLIGKSKREFMDASVRLVEEKFGMKVRICGNCKYLVNDPTGRVRVPGCAKSKALLVDPFMTFPHLPIYDLLDTCMGKSLNGVLNAWEPKELKSD